MHIKKVLAIDDDEGALELLKMQLNALGIEALLANNADEGLKLAKSRHPDAILLDMMMPGVPGDELAATLGDDPNTSDIPIIFLSALTEVARQWSGVRDTEKAIRIMLVEDNLGDVCLTREAFKDCRIRNNMDVVGDGAEAMAFLRREGKYADAPRPDLILLDWNLPKKDGREVLAEIKGDEGFRRIPVVILTVSSSQEDIHKAYDLHGNCYITKPVGLDPFMDVVRTIEDFWLSIVKLPGG